jgi:SAM-dependent methyltransferase
LSPARFDPASYGAWFDTALGRRVWKDEQRAVAEHLGLVKGRRVLDAGCGDGRLAAVLARQPLASESVDAVVAVTTLCFVPDAAAAVRVLSRVLRPGGRLVIGELGRWSIWAFGRRVRALMRPTQWRTARFWTKPGLVRLLGGAGVTPAGVRGAVFYPRSTWLSSSLRGLDQILGRRTAVGAAFVVAAADKPEQEPLP